MKIDGGCHCGHITYEAEVDPETAAICHCTDCQNLSGTAFRTVVQATEENFRLLSGEPKTYIKTGTSGTKRAQTFCPECGAPLHSSGPEDEHRIYNIRLGTVRQRDRLVPKRQIWTRSAQDWRGQIEGLPGVEQQ